jgi:outer membrane biosynthesis protein TonB
VHAKGSLKETELRSLLEGAQSERATGTLTVKNDGQSYTLYFLFGHLFHATGEGASGDDAVLGALRWHDGDFAFDAKAKLPADETVKSSIPELVNAASDNGAGPTEAVSQSPPAEAPAAEEKAPPPPARAEEPERPKAAEEPVDAPARKGVKHRPQPKHGREPIPVPAGEVVYDSLKTSFVDFPRLITTLENEGYTGYVRLLTEHASGLILFHEGKAQECVFDPGDKLSRGREALLAFNEEVTHGHGVLDVVGLPAEIVDGLYDLVVARPIYTNLFAAWVDMPALLEYLHEQKLTGSVMVRGEGGTGIIILTEGKATGAYTSESRSIDEDPKVVLDLCSDRNAMIEVKAADGSTGRPPLEVDEVVGSRSRGGRGGTAVAPAPVPEPAPAPPPAPVAQTASMPAYSTEQIPAPQVADTTAMPAFREEPRVEAAPPLAPPSAAPSGRSAPNWEAVVEELQGMADRALGARSRKVKDLLGSAERSQAGIEAAVSQVSQISLLFVDSALLVKLEQDMRAQLQTYL